MMSLSAAIYLQYVSTVDSVICTQSFLPFGMSSWKINAFHLPIFFKVPSLAMGQSYDGPIAIEKILKDMGK